MSSIILAYHRPCFAFWLPEWYARLAQRGLDHGLFAGVFSACGAGRDHSGGTFGSVCLWVCGGKHHRARNCRPKCHQFAGDFGGAGQRGAVESIHLETENPQQFIPCVDRRDRWRGIGAGRRTSGSNGRIVENSDLALRLPHHWICLWVYRAQDYPCPVCGIPRRESIASSRKVRLSPPLRWD